MATKTFTITLTDKELDYLGDLLEDRSIFLTQQLWRGLTNGGAWKDEHELNSGIYDKLQKSWQENGTSQPEEEKNAAP